MALGRPQEEARDLVRGKPCRKAEGRHEVTATNVVSVLVTIGLALVLGLAYRFLKREVEDAEGFMGVCDGDGLAGGAPTGPGVEVILGEDPRSSDE